MKKKNQPFGIALSRAEMKTIIGGQPWDNCPVGSGVTDCVCSDGGHACAPGIGGTVQQACEYACFHYERGGGFHYQAGVMCVAGACQP